MDIVNCYTKKEIFDKPLGKLAERTRELYRQDGAETGRFLVDVNKPYSQNKEVYFDRRIKVALMPYDSKNFNEIIQGIPVPKDMKKHPEYSIFRKKVDNVKNVGRQRYNDNDVMRIFTTAISPIYLEKDEQLLSKWVHATAQKIFREQISSVELPAQYRDEHERRKLHAQRQERYQTNSFDNDFLMRIREAKTFGTDYNRISQIRGLEERVADHMVRRLTGKNVPMDIDRYCALLIDDRDVEHTFIFDDISMGELIDMGIEEMLEKYAGPAVVSKIEEIKG